jgi:hypothetical protein
MPRSDNDKRFWHHLMEESIVNCLHFFMMEAGNEMGKEVERMEALLRNEGIQEDLESQKHQIGKHWYELIYKPLRAETSSAKEKI